MQTCCAQSIHPPHPRNEVNSCLAHPALHVSLVHFHTYWWLLGRHPKELDAPILPVYCHGPICLPAHPCAGGAFVYADIMQADQLPQEGLPLLTRVLERLKLIRLGVHTLIV